MANQQPLNELALFAGAGGGILGGHLLGWRTVCAVEWEPYPASVLCARQNDGLLPPFPIWDDVQTFDGKPWRGIVDVVSGGFPCQDISAAGRGAGIDGERSGMWREMARIIYEVRPQFAFVENSPMLTSRGLGIVLGDLAAMGFDARWGVLGAADVGANHQRDRIWIVAKHRHTNGIDEHSQQEICGGKATNASGICGKMANASELLRNGGDNNARISMERKAQSEFGNHCGAKNVGDTHLKGLEGTHNNAQLSQWVQQKFSERCEEISNASSLRQQGQGQHEQSIHSETGSQRQTNYAQSIGRPEFWSTEPNVGRVADGVAARVDRLKAIGNGQVPLCAATAWRILGGE